MLRFGSIKLRRFTPKSVRRFVIVGGTAAILYFAISWLLVIKVGVSPVVAVSAAFIAAVLWNYLMHYHWTFTSEKPHTITARRFGLMVAVGFVLNWTVVAVGTNVLGVDLFLTQFTAAGFVVVANFAISTLWVFADG